MFRKQNSTANVFTTCNSLKLFIYQAFQLYYPKSWPQNRDRLGSEFERLSWYCLSGSESVLALRGQISLPRYILFPNSVIHVYHISKPKAWRLRWTRFNSFPEQRFQYVPCSPDRGEWESNVHVWIIPDYLRLPWNVRCRWNCSYWCATEQFIFWAPRWDINDRGKQRGKFLYILFIGNEMTFFYICLLNKKQSPLQILRSRWTCRV